jgi:DNA-binding MarR family transcriptional regulator
VPDKSTASYRFGDLLALARLNWVRQMAEGLAALGYDDYRRSDALVMRLLLREPVSIKRLGEATGVTRQAARKMADGLERRGFASMARAQSDARQTNITLTGAGAEYARAVVSVIERLNNEICARVDPADLAGASRVLHAVVTGDFGKSL